jgi:hypothetical protein
MSGLYANPERDRELVRTALRNAGFGEAEAQQRLGASHEALELQCELTTVSTFLQEEGVERVDLLKIDVERAELDVLAGIDDSDWPRIRQVVVEVHDEEGRAARIERMLAQHGFRVVIDQDRAMRGTPVRMAYATRLPAA